MFALTLPEVKFNEWFKHMLVDVQIAQLVRGKDKYY